MYCLFIHLSCVVEVQRSRGAKPEAELRDDVTVQMMTDVMQKQGLEMNAVTKLSEQQVLVVFRDIICATCLRLKLLFVTLSEFPGRFATEGDAELTDRQRARRRLPQPCKRRVRDTCSGTCAGEGGR